MLLFLASHGFSDQTGNYYFLPQDGEYNDVESVLSGKNLSGKASTLLSWTDFFDNMRKAAGRRILIVDTCQAKSIFGEFDPDPCANDQPPHSFRCCWLPRGMNSHRNMSRHNMAYSLTRYWRVYEDLQITTTTAELRWPNFTTSQCRW